MHALASSASTSGATGAAIIFILIGAVAYFVPAIVAWSRHVPNAGSVTVLNVFLGWTLVGWVVALMMACRSRYQAVVTPYGFQPPQFPGTPGTQVNPYPQPQVRDDMPPGYR